MPGFESRNALLLALMLVSCSSSVSVRKADDDTLGVRYCLPQPFLLVKPMPDGTVSVEEVILPDPSQEYAADVSATLSTLTFNMKLEAGLLKEVTLNNDATGVAQKIAEGAGTVGEAALAEVTAAKKADQKAIDDKRVEIDKARQELAMAQATLDTLLEQSQSIPGLEAKIQQAAVDVAKAHAKLKELEDELQELRGRSRSSDRNAAMATTGPATGPGTWAGANVWGAVLLRVCRDPSSGAVSLVPVPFEVAPPTARHLVQMQFPTWVRGAVRAQAPVLSLVAPVVTARSRDAALLVRSERALKEVLSVQVMSGVDDKTGAVLKGPTANVPPLSEDPLYAVLQVVKGAPVGVYSLKLKLKAEDGTVWADDSLRFEVR